MLHFIQYLRGYVRIHVWGYSPERFINLCGNHNILLWEIRNHGDYYSMCLTVEGFRRIRPIVKKTGTKAVIQKRCGLPFFMPVIRQRKVFLAGLAGSLGFWMWMSTFIWAIELQGNTFVSTDVFMDFLKQNQVYVGMKKKDVDIEALEKQIRQKFGIVTWTSARMDGTRLEIQLRENELGTEESDVRTGEEKSNNVQENHSLQEHHNVQGADLIADQTGVIVEMITRQGVPAVAVGSEVKKGDLLVSGGVPVYQEDGTVKGYQVYEADADIFIRRVLRKTMLLPLYEEKKNYTGEKKKHMFFSFLGKEWVLGLPAGKYEQYDRVTEKKQVRLLENFYLPVFYGWEVNREYTVQKKEYTKEEVKKIFFEKLSLVMEEFQEKGVEIMKKNVTINKVPQNWQMIMDFEIIERIGEKVPVSYRRPAEEVMEGVGNGTENTQQSAAGQTEHSPAGE